MPILYSREETEKEIIIIWKYFPLYYFFLILLMVSAFVFDNPFVSILFGIFLLVFLVANIKPILEIRKAMKTGSVQVSGQKYSLSNPLKTVIKK